MLVESAVHGERPLAVSHWSTETHKARQLALLTQLRERFRPWTFPLVGLPLHGVGDDPPDSSQRSRGFLYAAIATAVAGELGVDDVRFGDNGPVSINLPINDQLVGALASRSTHPQFLHRFNQLAKQVFSTPVTVTNPLRSRTRAEALGVVKAARCADLLPLTNSCAKWRGLPAATPHCGGCSQCIDRRFATIAAGLEEHDPVMRYRRDVFLDDPVNWEADQTAQSYVRFAQRVFSLGDAAIIDAYPQVFDVPTPGDGDPEQAIQVSVELAKRHAATTLQVVKTIADRHLDDLVEGRLPMDCLLRKIMGGVANANGGQETEVTPISLGVPVGSAAVATSDNGECTRNTFVYEGDVWTVVFRGTAKRMRSGVAMTRLGILLREPGREFSAEEILLIERGTDGDASRAPAAEVQGLLPEWFASGGTKLDNHAVRAYKDEVRHVLRDLDEARDDGDAVRVAELEEYVQRIGRELQTGTGLGGTLRPYATALTRNQNTVYQSLHRVLLKIAKVHPELGEHLTRSVRLETSFVYAPEGGMTWHVALPQKPA